MDRKKRELHYLLAPLLKRWGASPAAEKEILHEMLVNQDTRTQSMPSEDELIQRKWMIAAGLDIPEDYE